MNTIQNTVRGLALITALLMISGVQAQTPAAKAVVPDNVIQVEQGTHRLMRSAHSVSRVAVGNPAVADVNVVNRREILVTGKTLGVTSLIVWSGKASKEYRVVVGVVKNPLFVKPVDPEFKNATIDQGLSLEGKLPNMLAYRRALSSAQQGSKEKVADRSSVEGESQVMTEVKIAEISRRSLKEYGFNLGSTNMIGHTGTLTANTGIAATPLQNAFNIAFSSMLGSGGSSLTAALTLMESRGLARTLAEPSLVAMSGQTASYLAGGEFPVPVSQGGTNNGAVTIQYKEFGVRLNITPTILTSHRIAMKVAPEVSDLDFSSGIQVGGVAVPSLTVRRTDTTVELGDGESFVISGLVSSNLVNSINKVPGLGDIPILGAFFKSTSLRREDKELVMVVTPHLVRPLARGAALPRLPGAKYDKYDPNWAQTILFENGDNDIGFSP
jgi:pilus assembly protein CpaC